MQRYLRETHPGGSNTDRGVEDIERVAADSERRIARERESMAGVGEAEWRSQSYNFFLLAPLCLMWTPGACGLPADYPQTLYMHKQTICQLDGTPRTGYNTHATHTPTQ